MNGREIAALVPMAQLLKSLRFEVDERLAKGEFLLGCAAQSAVGRWRGRIAGVQGAFEWKGK